MEWLRIESLMMNRIGMTKQKRSQKHMRIR